MQRTPITLEQQLADLCKEHVLEALSIEMHMRKDGTFFVSSYAHASDDERRFCGSSGKKGYDAQTAAVAIGHALDDLNTKRIPDLVPMGDPWRELAADAIATVEDAVRETSWGQPTFGPDAAEELQARYDTLATGEAA